MPTLNVKVPEGMEDDIEAYLADHPHYLNKSEFVRDALRRLLESPALSERTLEDDRVSREQIDRGDTVPLEDL